MLLASCFLVFYRRYPVLITLHSFFSRLGGESFINVGFYCTLLPVYCTEDHFKLSGTYSKPKNQQSEKNFVFEFVFET